MQGKDWVSERILFGGLILLGYMALLGTTFLAGVPKGAETLINIGMGTLGTALGAVVSAVFRTDKTDKANAESIAQLSKAVSGQVPSS